MSKKVDTGPDLSIKIDTLSLYGKILADVKLLNQMARELPHHEDVEGTMRVMSSAMRRLDSNLDILLRSHLPVVR